MGKGVRIGIIVEAIVLVAAIILSLAYFRMGLFRSDKGFDIWLLIVWVLVAAILLFILWSRSLTREELTTMSYGFEVADVPDDFRPKFIISTNSFQFHNSGEDDDGGAVIDQWKGSLTRVGVPGDEASYTDLGSYENVRELARLLEDNGAFL